MNYLFVHDLGYYRVTILVKAFVVNHVTHPNAQFV